MKRLQLVLLTLTFIGFTSHVFAGVRDKLGIGFNVTSQKLYGNHNVGTFEFGGNPVNLRFAISPVLFLETDLGFVKSGVNLSAGTLLTDMFNVGFKFGYRFLNGASFNPLLYVGSGGLSYEAKSGRRVYDGYGAVGGGAEVFVTNNFGLNLTADYRFTSGDDFDGAAGGRGKDAFLNLGFGLNYYFKGNPGKSQDYWAFTMPDELNAVENAETQEPVSQDDPAEIERQAMLAYQRDQLLYSIEQRDQDIRLLQAKVTTLDAHADELSRQMELTAPAVGAELERDDSLVHYRNALVLFEAGYHENAIESFTALLRDHPSHAMVGNWWYWLGECQYSLANYEASTQSFESASVLLGSGSKGEMTFLMLGLSQWKGGDPSAAKQTFEYLVSARPGSRFAELAKEYLAELELQ